jgi:hypothetical protein
VVSLIGRVAGGGGAGGGGVAVDGGGSGGITGASRTGGGGGGGGPVGLSGGSGVVVLVVPAVTIATFSPGVTASQVVGIRDKVITVAATSTTSETVTFT